jgi:hypothetical protein
MSKVKTVIANKENLRTELVTEDETIKAITTQDITKTLKYVKDLGEYSPGNDLRHVAEVPIVIYEKAVLEGWANDMSAWKKWLNSPENKPFRTWQGKI